MKNITGENTDKEEVENRIRRDTKQIRENRWYLKEWKEIVELADSAWCLNAAPRPTRTVGHFRTIGSVLFSNSPPTPHSPPPTPRTNWQMSLPLLSAGPILPPYKLPLSPNQSSIFTPNYPSKFATEFFIGLVKNGFLFSPFSLPRELFFCVKIMTIVLKS